MGRGRHSKLRGVSDMVLIGGEFSGRGVFLLGGGGEGSGRSVMV